MAVQPGVLQKKKIPLAVCQLDRPSDVTLCGDAIWFYTRERGLSISGHVVALAVSTDTQPSRPDVWWQLFQPHSLHVDIKQIVGRYYI